MKTCVWACVRLLQVWGSEEDVGEVLFLNVFVFSPSRCRAVGFRATEGKINTEQTSPGTQAIPRGILGMWLRMSGLPLLPHPENCPWRPKIQRKMEKVLWVCVYWWRGGLVYAVQCETKQPQWFEYWCDRGDNLSNILLPCTRILNFPLCPNPPSITPVSPVDSVTFNPTKSWRLVSFLNRLRPITV